MRTAINQWFDLTEQNIHACFVIYLNGIAVATKFDLATFTKYCEEREFDKIIVKAY